MMMVALADEQGYGSELLAWGVPEYDEFGDLELLDEDSVPVSDWLKATGDSVIYLYDFGDDWQDEIVLEKIIPPDSSHETGLPSR